MSVKVINEIATCPFCWIVNVFERGKQINGCSHFKRLEQRGERVMAIFEGEWGVELKEAPNEQSNWPL